MRLSHFPRLNYADFDRSGPRLIAVGLVVLILSTWTPVAPVVTGMSIVTLGATIATRRRYRGSAGLVPMLLIHFVVYGGLYALFVGATIHAAAGQPDAVRRIMAVADVAMSVWPVALAVELLAKAVSGERRSN